MNNQQTTTKIFVTSDTHFGHKNILKFAKDSRPFDSVADMDQALIDSWNSVVGKNDLIYHLGDLSFHKKNKTIDIIKQLNGIKYQILGNHDGVLRHRDFDDLFAWRGDYKKIVVDGVKVILFHYPILHWDSQQHSSMMLHGHLHSNRVDVNTMDIGADSNNLMPYNMRDIITQHHTTINSDPRPGRSKIR